jgi:hypothetical protein
MNSLRIFSFFNFFFIEKKKLFTNTKLLKKRVFCRKLQILHNKVFFLKNFDFYLFFNKNFFPLPRKKRFVRRLFRFWKKKFFKSKLKKINYYFLKTLILKKKKWIKLKEIYYISKNAYFSNISLLDDNFFSFKKAIISTKMKRMYSSRLFFNFFKNYFFKKLKIKKYWLSNFISSMFKWIFLSKFILCNLKWILL